MHKEGGRVHCCCLLVKPCPTLATPWTGAHQALLSMEVCRQEYCSVLPCPSPGDLPDSGTELMSPALASGFFATEPPGKPRRVHHMAET